ncbi:U-box domain-containing protein 35-like isoform X4 [Diospyros lotus]|uniref:U-box domain-containing protein 35-like isoform X4 n=1 Tax=Diospyros lotus TaxID=55363 RepID=UPI00225943CB|nr:U-box domain-containing protein 35-like isoform X4 [Diospyros lotus]
MWMPRNGDRKQQQQHQQQVVDRLVAVAVDRDRGSHNALKWAIDNLLSSGQTVVLIHVTVHFSASSYQSSPSLSSQPSKRFSEPFDIIGRTRSVHEYTDSQAKEFFLPFRCFCIRKDIQCLDVVLEDSDIVKALVEYVTQSAIEVLVLGAPSKNGFLRKLKATDIPGSVSKRVPDFCTVFTIYKDKVSSTRCATRTAPAVSPLRNLILQQAGIKKDQSETALSPVIDMKVEGTDLGVIDINRLPFTHRKYPHGKSYGELSPANTDISFVSSGRASIDHSFPSCFDSFESRSPRLSSYSEFDRPSFESLHLGHRSSVDTVTPTGFSLIFPDSDISSSSQTMEDIEAEMRRLKLELRQTMDMYSTACKEALMAKQKAKELERWRMEEEKKLEEMRLAEEAALAIVEEEREKSRAAIEAAEVHQKIAELEAQKRINAEKRALKEVAERNRVLNNLAQSDSRYRRYTIEEIEVATDCFSESRKIGEGGYGSVFKCHLDHTPVAVKVLRPDAAQGRSQFQQEIEVLSCIRHPNLVLLLGACPEYGCLVYEYMSNGSLEDRLFQKGNTPPLSWQLRFRIAAEISTALLVLHQTKPEPLVHRDLKPANILLDRNYVSKISDVGLARLVPPSVADNVTQYRMTSTAGTFCYIDPEYQQTGMLGVKSDVYSLGIMLLQIITAKPPMGLTYHVERAIEKGTFAEMLDPAVLDWPIEEALSFAKIALKCAELRRKDRPDLDKVVLPELERLREIAEDNMVPSTFGGANAVGSANRSQASISQVSRERLHKLIRPFMFYCRTSSTADSPTSHSFLTL